MSVLQVVITIVHHFFFRFLTHWYVKLRFVSQILLGQKSQKAAIVISREQHTPIR